MKDRYLKTVFVAVTLFMSATLLYGGYQVHREADKKSDYEQAARQKAVQVSMNLCEEMEAGSFESAESLQDPLEFLRVCAEELR